MTLGGEWAGQYLGILESVLQYVARGPVTRNPRKPDSQIILILTDILSQT